MPLMELQDFQNPEFTGSIAGMQICQILNDKSPTTVGLFVKASTLELIGWEEESPNYEHTFSSGAVEKGILYKSPKMHILATSPRFIELRESKEIVGNYETPDGRKQYLELGDKATLRSFYMIYLLGKENQNLHKVPLVLSIHGVAAAKFGEAVNSFKVKMEIAYAQRFNCGYRSLNKQFHCLCAFNPTFKPSLEPPNGAKKSWVAIPETVAMPSSPELEKFICLEKSQELWGIAASSNGFANNILKTADDETPPLLAPTHRVPESLPPQTVETTALTIDEDEIPY